MSGGPAPRAARWIKRWLPTSLFYRSLLIIVLPVALMQAAVTYVFFDAHWQTVTSRLSESLAGDIALLVQDYRADPSPAGLAKLESEAEVVSLSVAVKPGDLSRQPARPAFFAPVGRAMDRALREKIHAPYWFDTDRYPDYVDIRVQVAPQTYLRVLAPRARAYAASGPIFLLWMAVATLLLLAVAIGFIANQVRAIERLAAAAEAFGRGIDDAEFKPHGAREVRQAARAFISMKARIQRHIEQRTALLASVSHDLRTPLTRLKLELAMREPDAGTAAMKRDLSEMEHMIDEYLDFARGEGAEALENVDLSDLLETVATDARRAGAEVVVRVEEGLSADLRPNAMRRALANLLANAGAHAALVEISAAPTLGGGVEIAVDDDGPGIAPERREEAFKPFARLDPSRNQNLKGVGLGLAIVRDVARAHGGDVTLETSPLGGLRAVIRLPG